MTPNAWILVSVIAALVVMAGLVVLRVLTNNRAEVRLSDAAIAVLPVVIALFAGGKIEELVIGKEGITVKAAKQAIVSAAGGSLGESVTSLSKLDYNAFDMGPKGGSAQLAALKRANVGVQPDPGMYELLCRGGGPELSGDPDRESELPVCRAARW